MLSDFEAKEIKKAKRILEQELRMIQNIHERQKEEQEVLYKKPSLWSRLKAYLGQLF